MCDRKDAPQGSQKEIPWGQIAETDRPLYKQAETRQWAEHLKYEAVRVLTAEETQKVRDTVEPDRVLSSRFAYRDKNAGLRVATAWANLPVKAKA